MPFESYSALKERKPFKWWHDAIIDSMLAEPLINMTERAEKLGYSVSYLSAIMNSDMFKAAYAARREHYSQTLDASLTIKTARVAEKGLDILLEQLTVKRTALPFQQVATTTLSVLEKLGYGAKVAATPQVQVTVQQNNGQQVVAPVSAEALASARQKLRGVEQQRLEGPRPQSFQASEEDVVEAIEVEQGATRPPSEAVEDGCA